MKLADQKAEVHATQATKNPFVCKLGNTLFPRQSSWSYLEICCIGNQMQICLLATESSLLSMQRQLTLRNNHLHLSCGIPLCIL